MPGITPSLPDLGVSLLFGFCFTTWNQIGHGFSAYILETDGTLESDSNVDVSSAA